MDEVLGHQSCGLKSALVLVTLIFLLNLIPDSLKADQVYKWQDENGVVHYSSAPHTSKMKPAVLPPITRGDIKLGRINLQDCSKHGGINCQLGSDLDGSVVCFDGFKASTERYKSNCSSPELEIADISEPRDDGAVSIFVRNKRSVDAFDTVVKFKQGNRSEIALKGPNRIEAFGLGEFLYQPLERGFGDVTRPKENQLKLSCRNCAK